jgi:hypothetical protein
MFERPRHQRIHEVLLSLDAAMLREHRCYFGGGTAIVLKRDEYRESLDIDFLLSDLLAKAEHAYGPAVLKALQKSGLQLLERPACLTRCIESLQITTPQALLHQNIANLLHLNP